MYDIIVIGGGASGMMAAGRAAELGKKVLLLEKNKSLGEKLKISGGGRCNITNAQYDVHELLKKYGKAEQFLYSPFAQFGVAETFSFFESHGLPLVVQARNRAFPKTEKAADVCKVLESYIKKVGVEVRTSAAVTRVESGSDGVIAAVHVGKEVFRAHTFIFATGSVSHPETGSTGDGFNWLRKLGHTVHKPSPTIVPLQVQEEWVKQLSGTSLSFMKISFYVEGKKSFAETGKILFTHFGVSGPLILNSAHKVADLLQVGAVTATIDAYPHTDLGALEKKVITVFDANKNKTLKNIIREFVPDGTHKGVTTHLSIVIDVTKKVHMVTREERKKIVHTLKALPLTIVGLMGFDRAVVADGGVPLTEVDPKSMRSLKVPNLFVTGDLLHINRPSGGYSLQLCWTTGFVVGTHAAK
jgi:predicted Rossmann fold flavoprotein